MGVKIDSFKEKNLSNIRLGSCIELLILLDNFDMDFKRLEDFLIENSLFLNNQNESILKEYFSNLKGTLINSLFILLDDIDKDSVYCNYMNRYY